jgi:hypothetical protein
MPRSLTTSVKDQMHQDQKEAKFVYNRIPLVKAEAMQLANQADIFNMDLEQFIAWFDDNASRLFRSVAYSRIKNHTHYQFAHYVETRKKLIHECGKTHSSLSVVRRNSKLRTSFTVHTGPMLKFGSTMLFGHALTIQELPEANNISLKYCVQFSSKFTKIANRFCEDIKPEIVMRALRDVRSTAIYHIADSDIITY